MIKLPHPDRLLLAQLGPYRLRQPLKHLITINVLEESRAPLLLPEPLSLPHRPLPLLHFPLLVARRLHVPLVQRVNHAPPRPPRLPRVLFADGRNVQRHCGFCIRVIRLEISVARNIVHRKSVIPPPLGRVQRLLVRIARAVEAGFESVLGAAHAEETLSGEADLCDEAGGAGDVVRAVEFWVGRPCQKAFDFDVGERDQVVFVVGVQVEDGVADLPNVDGAVEGYFLAGVSFGLCWPVGSDGVLKGSGPRWRTGSREND